jgi:uncharacterized protein (DUF342 family)
MEPQPQPQPQARERKFVAQRQQQGIDRSKAAKLFINTYYKKLVEQGAERQERLDKLEEETVGLSEREQELARAALAQDESQHMRLQRTKLSVGYARCSASRSSVTHRVAISST